MANLAIVRPRNGAPAWGLDPFYNFFSPFSGDVDVIRTDEGYTVDVAVPGFAPEQIDVTAKDGVLTVDAKSDRRTLRRSLMIPEDVDQEKIAAKVEHGLLTLTLSRHAQAMPRKIKVDFSSN